LFFPFPAISYEPMTLLAFPKAPLLISARWELFWLEFFLIFGHILWGHWRVKRLFFALNFPVAWEWTIWFDIIGVKSSGNDYCVHVDLVWGWKMGGGVESGRVHKQSNSISRLTALFFFWLLVNGNEKGLLWLAMCSPVFCTFSLLSHCVSEYEATPYHPLNTHFSPTHLLPPHLTHPGS